MAGVEAQQLALRDRVAEIELVRADDVALRADAKQLRFDRVEIVPRVELLGEDLIERLPQPLARSLAVDRRVLLAVRNPDVGDARRTERLAHRRADPAAARCRARPRTAGSLRRGGSA